MSPQKMATWVRGVIQKMKSTSESLAHAAGKMERGSTLEKGYVLEKLGKMKDHTDFAMRIIASDGGVLTGERSSDIGAYHRKKNPRRCRRKRHNPATGANYGIYIEGKQGMKLVGHSAKKVSPGVVIEFLRRYWLYPAKGKKSIALHSMRTERPVWTETLNPKTGKVV